MILPLLSILLALAVPLNSLPTEGLPITQTVNIPSQESTEPNTRLPVEEISPATPLPTTTEEEASSTTPLPTTTEEEASSTTPLTTTTVDTTDRIVIMNTSVPAVTEIALTIESEAKLLNLLSASNEKFIDREVRWLVLEKTTHIDIEEESVFDPRSGKTRRKSSENRHEALKVLRDNRYGSDENEVNYVKAFQM